MRKPTKAELELWEEQLRKNDLSMRRGESHRLVYNSSDKCRLFETSWRNAKLYTKKKWNHFCVVCGSKFLGRADAKCCSAKCRDVARSRRHPNRKHRKGATDNQRTPGRVLS